MLTKPILFSLALFLTLSLFSQSYTQESAESLGRGGTGAAGDSYSSVYLNPAGIANQKYICFTVNYYLPYLLPDLSVRQFSVILPFKKGTVFSTVNQYGAELYHENKVVLGFSKALSPHFRASFSLQYLQIFQSGYNDGQIFASCGIQYDIFKELSLGIFILNPEQSSIRLTDGLSERINSVYYIGSLWKVSDDVRLLYDVEKVTDLHLIHHFGIDYFLNNSLCFRCGILGKPVYYCIGTGVIMKRLSLNVGMMVHQVLGMSSSISLTYNISQKL